MRCDGRFDSILNRTQLGTIAVDRIQGCIQRINGRLCACDTAMSRSRDPDRGPPKSSPTTTGVVFDAHLHIDRACRPPMNAVELGVGSNTRHLVPVHRFRLQCSFVLGRPAFPMHSDGQFAHTLQNDDFVGSTFRGLHDGDSVVGVSDTLPSADDCGFECGCHTKTSSVTTIDSSRWKYAPVRRVLPAVDGCPTLAGSQY